MGGKTKQKTHHMQINLGVKLDHVNILNFNSLFKRFFQLYCNENEDRTLQHTLGCLISFISYSCELSSVFQHFIYFPRQAFLSPSLTFSFQKNHQYSLATQRADNDCYLLTFKISINFSN